jgi:hypothetical protein
MTVTGTGIVQPGVNTISSLTATTVTLAVGGNTSSNGTTLTFTSGVCVYDQYLSINNGGLTAISSFIVIATSTTTSGKSIQLQTCSGGTWNEATDACSGAIVSLTTTIGAGSGANSPQTATISLPLAESGTLRLRALSNQLGKSITVGIRVAQANLRASTSTNG